MSLLMLPSAFSQVTIKEKLDVGSPHARTQDDSHTLVFSFSRPNGVITQQPYYPYQTLTNNMLIHNDACGESQTVNVDGGAGTVTFNDAVSGGWYTIEIGMCTVTAGEAYLDIFLDGVQICHYVDYRDAPTSPLYASGDFVDVNIGQPTLFFFTGYTYDVSAYRDAVRCSRCKCTSVLR